MSKKTVVVVSQSITLTSIVGRFLENDYQVIVFSQIQFALDFVYNSIPDLVIIDLFTDDKTTVEILNNLKEDPIFHQLPVLAVLSADGAFPRWESLFVEDFIFLPDLEREIKARTDLCILRSERVVEINPLTRLPGNVSINREIQNRIEGGEVFAIGYADLDHFKPFNDRYGFSRGDEVIKMTGRLILNTVKNRQSRRSFVGHIGGDDFLFLTEVDFADEISEEIIGAFDRIVPTFYDPDDRQKGCITSKDRQGRVRTFPLITISIGVTNTTLRTFSHYGEITEAVSQLKHYAKRFNGSCYRSDKRHPSADTK